MLAAALAVAVGSATTPVVEREPGTHIAFVGELISLVEDKSEGSCDSEEAPSTAPPVAAEGNAPGPLESICIPHFNRVFEARYRVVERLAGDLQATELAFRIADHRGTPPFAQLEHALLVVTLDEDGAYLQEYMGFGAHRLVDGGWATCGQDESAARTPPSARPLPFAEPIRDLRGDDAAQVAGWRADPDLRIEDGQLFCARGVPLDEYLDYLREGVLAARGVVLEAAPAER